MVTSSQNAQVRFIKSLKKRKLREEAGCFFIEGLRSVCEGIISGADNKTLVLSESFIKSEFYAELKKALDSAEKFSVESVLFPVSDAIYAQLTDLETPQGIGAVFSIKRPKKVKGESIVLLENLQDPGNMGTIIRTADAAAFDGVICTKGCVDVYNPKVLRSTTGSVFHIPIMQYLRNDDITVKELTAALKESGYTVYAAHPRGECSCFEEPFEGKSVIVIGTEANGVTDEMLSCCDKLLTIPMPGKAESLNASVAAALLIYDIRRKN